MSGPFASPTRASRAAGVLRASTRATRAGWSLGLASAQSIEWIAALRWRSTRSRELLLTHFLVLQRLDIGLERQNVLIL